MSGNVRSVKHYPSRDTAVKPLAGDGSSFRGDSPVVDLQRQLARHFGEPAGNRQMVLEPLPLEEVLLHGISRTLGVTALIFGYAAAAYLIGQVF